MLSILPGNEPENIRIRIDRLFAKLDEAGLLTSMEFLKALLELAKDVVQVEKETVPEIVERIVNDIDGIVRIVRFPGWQNTSTGRKEVSKNLRDVIMRKYRIKDQEVFSKAYSYVEQYY